MCGFHLSLAFLLFHIKIQCFIFHGCVCMGKCRRIVKKCETSLPQDENLSVFSDKYIRFVYIVVDVVTLVYLLYYANFYALFFLFYNFTHTFVGPTSPPTCVYKYILYIITRTI